MLVMKRIALAFLIALSWSCKEEDDKNSAGEICISDFFCQDGLSCINGTCSSGGLNEPCRYPFQCADSLFCNSSGRCEQKKNENMACDTNDACNESLVCYNDLCRRVGEKGDPCKDDSHCKGALVCGNNICGEGEVGDSCTYKSDCQAGLICHNNTCSDKRIATASCGNDSDCNSGLFCGNDKRCNAGDMGDSCTFDRNCPSATLSCINNNCANLSSASQTCDSNSDCNTGLFCNNSSPPVCQTKLSLGEDCQTYEQCQSDICVTVCINPKADGETCEQDRECISNRCGNNLCSSGNEGDPCTYNSDCNGPLICFSTSLERLGEAKDQSPSEVGGNPCLNAEHGVPCCARARTAPHGICSFSSQCEGEDKCLNNYCSAGERGHSCAVDNNCNEDLLCDIENIRYPECQPIEDI